MVVIIKDKDLKPENIKKGVTILKVTGTYEGSGGQTINNQNKSVDASTASQSITADQGYTGLGTVTVNAVTSSIDSNIAAGNIRRGVNILGVTGTLYTELLETMFVTPQTQNVTWDASTLGKAGFASFTVKGVDASIDSNIQPGNIKDGVNILGVTGNYVGESPEILNQSKSVTPRRTLQVVTKDSGYTGLDDVTVYGVDASIDSNITPSNIKSGVSILGITGNYGGAAASMLVEGQAPYLVVLADLYTSVDMNHDLKEGYRLNGPINGAMCFLEKSFADTWQNNSTYEWGNYIALVQKEVEEGQTIGVYIHCCDCNFYSQSISLEDMESYQTLSKDGATWSSTLDIKDYVGPVYIKVPDGREETYIKLKYLKNPASFGDTDYNITFAYIRQMMPEPEMVTCPNCEGSGTDPNTGETCETCWGSGQVWP